jgi:alpha-ketoglutarate-dependent taurine dioxygenase
MILTNPIEFTSIDEVVNNAQYYKELFLKEKVLVFRNANLSNSDHQNFHDQLREKFGWHTKEDRSYTESHKRLIDNPNNQHKVKNNEIMLSWHVEHPYYTNPIVIATWNMHKFNTDSENGKTYFVDTELLFSKLSNDDQEFMKKWITEEPVSERSGIKQENKIIGYHWINNNPVIRVSHLGKTGEDFVRLKFVDDKNPTEKEYLEYIKIMKWIRNEILNNEDIRIVHRWKQGDLLIPDMYKLCHAVTGGFDPADREFTGIWGYRYPEESQQ